MDQEERIAELEKQVFDIKKRFDTLIEIHAEQEGYTRAFQQAVIAMISTFKPSPAFAESLKYWLASAEAGIVAEVKSEPYLSGMQRGQALLLAALDEALATDADGKC